MERHTEEVISSSLISPNFQFGFSGEERGTAAPLGGVSQNCRGSGLLPRSAVRRKQRFFRLLSRGQSPGVAASFCASPQTHILPFIIQRKGPHLSFRFVADGKQEGGGIRCCARIWNFVPRNGKKLNDTCMTLYLNMIFGKQTLFGEIH